MLDEPGSHSPVHQPLGSQGMEKDPPFKYRAFLSYSHRDTSWGRWLHGALESYRIDKDLVGRETRMGAVPKTLRPIFRDREEFSAGPSLTDQTRAALESSQALVVICSPNAARSPYVNDEIRRYKASGRADYVIPVIVDGEPGDPERECFPPALRFKVRPDGTITEQRDEPIAADARPQGDGKDVARLKVVAGLLGVGLDEIVRRSERAQRRRLRNWVAALASLTLILAGLAVWADINRREAVAQRQYVEQALDAGIRTANSLSEVLARYLRNRPGIRISLVKYLLDSAVMLQDKLSSHGRTTPDLQKSKAGALIEIEETLFTIGDNAGALDAAQRARQIFEGLAAGNPLDLDAQLNVALSYERIGDVRKEQGRIEEALSDYRKSLAIAQAVIDRASRNTRAHDALAVAYQKIGNVLYFDNKNDEALAVYRKSLDTYQTLLGWENDNGEWQRGLGVGYERVGDALFASGKRDEALAAFRRRFELAKGLADNNSDNTELQRELSVAYDKIGDVLLSKDKPPEEALDNFQKALEIRRKLADGDQENAVWQRDVASSYYKIGGAMVFAGRLDEALDSFRKTVGITQMLASGDPDNAQWQQDLLLSNGMIGAVLKDQGKLDAALKAYRDTLAIGLAQRKVHPEVTVWRDGVRYCASAMGELAYKLVRARQFGLALETAEQSISFAPDLIWVQLSRAHALMFLGRIEEARALYLRYRGEKNVWKQYSWRDLASAQFAELRAAGLARPLMDEIEQRFAEEG